MSDTITGDLFDDGPKRRFQRPNARKTDPTTSHLAAANAALRASPGRLKAMRLLAKGARTDFELAAASGLQQTSIGKRRHECMVAGLVRTATTEQGATLTRPAPSGSMATVWEITAAGQRWLAAQP